MNKTSTIVKHSLREIEDKRARGEDRTRADAPEARPLGKDFWKTAKVVMPRAKDSVHLRLDADVLGWFKAQGPGHLTRMNAVLRSYFESHRK
jgi:uncharacterized protein (DUF4415 family)